MKTPLILQVLRPVLEILEMLGIHYYIGGSVASSAYGIPRATMDIDIVADIKREHVDVLVKKLKSNYYIDTEMIHGAIQMESSFNTGQQQGAANEKNTGHHTNKGSKSSSYYRVYYCRFLCFLSSA